MLSWWRVSGCCFLIGSYQLLQEDEDRRTCCVGRGEDGIHHEGPAAAPEVEEPAYERQLAHLGLEWPLLVGRLEI